MSKENKNPEEMSFRVLSIQSHVVSGYVGNKSATFPLQLLGLEVDNVNSVQFSNHTGYKCIKGQVLKYEELQELYEGLKANDLLHYTHILTGYVGNETFLTKIVEIIKDLKTLNPDIQLVCDPVMGDNGQMYVPDAVLPIYKDHLVPIADILTPNQFEAELLTGIKIRTKEDILSTLDIFHQKGVKTIVLSSIDLDSSENLLIYGSSMQGGAKSIVHLEVPKLPCTYVGSGDLFSALLLAWMAKTNGNLKESCEKTANTMACVLKRTLDHSLKQKDPMSPFSVELKLIQSKRDIEDPSNDLKCQLL